MKANNFRFKCGSWLKLMLESEVGDPEGAESSVENECNVTTRWRVWTTVPMVHLYCQTKHAFLSSRCKQTRGFDLYEGVCAGLVCF